MHIKSLTCVLISQLVSQYLPVLFWVTWSDRKVKKLNNHLHEFEDDVKFSCCKFRMMDMQHKLSSGTDQIKSLVILVRYVTHYHLLSYCCWSVRLSGPSRSAAAAAEPHTALLKDSQLHFLFTKTEWINDATQETTWCNPNSSCCCSAACWASLHTTTWTCFNQSVIILFFLPITSASIRTLAAPSGSERFVLHGKTTAFSLAGFVRARPERRV